MTICKLNIQGFKCFNDSSLDLHDITVLCGSNGSGKSSVIQALLLARLAIEKNVPVLQGSYDLTKWKGVPVPLNGFYELTLGITDEIVNGHPFQIGVDGLLFSIAEEPEIHVREDEILFSYDHNTGNSNNFITHKEFYYLNAERIGPRYISEFRPYDFLNCGSKGENTAQVYLECDKAFFKVDPRRLFGKKSDLFRMQVDAWLNYICSDISVTVETLGNRNGQIKLRNSRLGKLSAATNIGFGISYLLPIIITGLIAKPGSMFIIENPEAHLHPKAQSNLGYFLGQIAASDVRILIETHSEHIVNGIRRAALIANTGLKPENVGIYFFKGFENITSDIESQETVPDIKYDAIRIEETGDLSSFPVDFFDQTRQDLSEILYLSHSR